MFANFSYFFIPPTAAVPAFTFLAIFLSFSAIFIDFAHTYDVKFDDSNWKPLLQRAFQKFGVSCSFLMHRSPKITIQLEAVG